MSIKIKKQLFAKGEEQQILWERARQIKEKNFGKKIWLRGIIEISNFCRCNCFYCGIRRGNAQVERFRMSLAEIKTCLDFIQRKKYGSVLFQSGELISVEFKKYLLEIVEFTHQNYPDLGITFSCGELDFAFLKKLKQAGAMRYLLRIESSNETFYQKNHPPEMSWQKRLQCLCDLRKLDYQTGTGVIVGLPGQTPEHLVEDLIFLKRKDFDMFGIGPYVIHSATPLGKNPDVQIWWEKNKKRNFNLFLNFLAILRIQRPDVNIAAATACDVFDPQGRIKVLKIAANVFMPNVTPPVFGKKYNLYQKKTRLENDPEETFTQFMFQIRKAGLMPMWGEQGNSPFYLRQKMA